MESLEPYLDKFSESGKRVLESALNETRRRNQHFISPEHILYALIEEEADLFNSTMQDLSVDPNSVRLALEKRLENSCRYIGQGFRIAPETTEIFKFSMDRARSQGRRVIEASDILYVMTRDKQILLNYNLQSHDNHSCALNANRISMEDKQSHFLSQLQTTSSNFLTQFSLQELVKKNYSPFGLFHSIGGISSGTSGGNSEQTNHSKHESFACRIESKDFNNFNEAEFISSLRKDVEDSINQSRLKITRTDSQNSSSFRFEYKKGKMEGQIDISGEMRDRYYELKAILVEKSGRKIK